MSDHGMHGTLAPFKKIRSTSPSRRNFSPSRVEMLISAGILANGHVATEGTADLVQAARPPEEAHGGPPLQTASFSELTVSAGSS